MSYESWPRTPSRLTVLVDVVGLAVVIPLAITIGSINLAAAGVRAMLRWLNDAEHDAMAQWDLALSGMTPNATIDKLIEEEDSAR